MFNVKLFHEPKFRTEISATWPTVIRHVISVIFWKHDSLYYRTHVKAQLTLLQTICVMKALYV